MKRLLELSALFTKYQHWLKKEAMEQTRLTLRLEERWYKYTAIPNSTRTMSFKQKIVNKLTWLNKWLCDMLIILKRWSILFIEMKLPREIWKSWKLLKSKSVVSEEQKEWVSVLNNIDNISAEICYWYEESIEKIEYYENL